MADYDILIIGGGPGGYVAGSYAAQFGKKVAVIEQQFVGGCCLNTGCIPTKVILEAAMRYSCAVNSRDYGIKTEKVSFSWAELKGHSDKIRESLRNNVAKLLQSRKCDVLKGKAALIDEHTVQAEGKIFTSDTIILATGARPSIPEKYAGLSHVLTSDSFWELEEQPCSIVIVGGGVVGCEIASAMSRLGTKITIIEQASEILQMFGSEAVKLLRDELSSYDVDILCGQAVSDVAEIDNRLRVSAGDQVIECEYLFWSTGREAEMIDTSGLPLKRTSHGFVSVDENFRTSIGNIYCIGDANGKNMLAHAAIAQAMLAVYHICTDNPVNVNPAVPQTVFTSPAIAKIGIMEGECANAAVGKVPYSAVGYSHVAGAEKGYFKVIRDIETDVLVGIEIVGYNACELIHNLVPFINRRLTTGMFSDIIYAHPTLTEGIKLAIEASYIRSPQA